MAPHRTVGIPSSARARGRLHPGRFLHVAALALVSFAVIAASLTVSAGQTDAASPRIVLSSTHGPAGTRVVIRGYHLPPRSRIQILWNGRFKGFPTAWVNRYGQFRVTITVPGKAPGMYRLKAVSVLKPSRKVVTRLSQLGRVRASAWYRITPTPTTAPVSGFYPADGSLSLVTTPNLARPAYLSPLSDPTWGTTTTRISNTAGTRHAYSRISAWNSDGSRLLLGFNYPARMLDGRTYADLGAFYQISGAIWANTDPNKLFGVDAQGNGNRLYSQNATSGSLTTLHSFTGYSYITIGDWEGGVDDNDRYIALIGTTSTGARHLITYDIATATVIADIVAPSGTDNAQISRKGTYVVVVGGGFTRRYTRDLTSYITLYAAGNHGDNALDANGTEIYVGDDNISAGIVSFRLSDGAATNLFPSFGKNMYFQPGHISGRNLDRPGWVYLSNYDTTFYGTYASYPGRDQVVAVKTDGSGTVEVFAFAHHTDTTTYADQPQAVPSRDGSRVLFASEWGGSGVFAYIASR